MIFFVCGFLIICLGLLGYRHQKLMIRCALAEERLKQEGALEEKFRHLSDEALHRSSKSLAEMAQGDLAQKQRAITEVMEKLEGSFRRVENERKQEHGAVFQQLKNLAEAEKTLKEETTNLVKALRSPLGRGQWGEIQLRRVVELSGMLSQCDFYEQSVGNSEEARVRPDLIVRLPGERFVVVDAKAPLEAYLDAIQSNDEAYRLLRLKDHARQVAQHIALLSKKSYWLHFQPSPEFVVLFLPSEAMFSAALEADPALIELGAQSQVIVATPTTLIALLRAVSYGWKQESLSRHAEKIRELGSELYKRVSDMAGHWSRVGKSLSSAVDSYNKATGSMEARVLVTARKFQELNVAPATIEIPESEQVEKTARALISEES